MEDHLRARAESLSALLDVGSDGIEFDAAPGAMPGFERPGSGAYVEITGPDGRVVVRSPSLGEERLPAPPPFEPGRPEFGELERGPGGFPCATIALGFLARADAGTPEAGRRFRITVALDSRERDAGLASLAWFLALAATAALLGTLGAGLLLARAVLRPIRRMTREAAALTPENADRRLGGETVVMELDSLAATLNSALDRLAEALERQKRFTSDASHELRTPVSVLMANTELLLRRPRTPEEYREGLERQLRTIRRMKGITENLLLLARAEAGSEEVGRIPVPLDSVLAAVCEEYEPLARGRRIRVERDLPGGMVVRGDPVRLSRLFGNLVANAVKFTPEGGSVAVRLRAAGERAECTVEDTGPGIPAQHRARVFERFYRVREGTEGSEGAGLGLSIADRIAKDHGGSIDVGEREGGGAVLRVLLPLEAPPAAVERPRTAAPTIAS